MHRDDVYCEHYDASLGNGGAGAQATMVRTQTHKLIAFHGEELGELYDLAQDPGEHENRWDDPAYETVKRELLVRLCDRMADTVDPLPPRVAPW